MVSAGCYVSVWVWVNWFGDYGFGWALGLRVLCSIRFVRGCVWCVGLVVGCLLVGFVYCVVLAGLGLC